MKLLLTVNLLASVVLGLWALSLSFVPAGVGMTLFLVGVFGSLWMAHDAGDR